MQTKNKGGRPALYRNGRTRSVYMAGSTWQQLEQLAQADGKTPNQWAADALAAAVKRAAKRAARGSS